MGIGSVFYGGNAFPWGAPRGKYAGSANALADIINSWQAGAREREMRGLEDELMDRRRTEWGREDELWERQLAEMDDGVQQDPKAIMALMEVITKKLDSYTMTPEQEQRAYQELATLGELYRRATGIPVAGAPAVGGGSPMAPGGGAGMDPRAELERMLPHITDPQERAALMEAINIPDPKLHQQILDNFQGAEAPPMGAGFAGPTEQKPEQEGKYNLASMASMASGWLNPGGRARQPLLDMDLAPGSSGAGFVGPREQRYDADTILTQRDKLPTSLQFILDRPPGGYGGYNQLPVDPYANRQKPRGTATPPALMDYLNRWKR